jgi:tight adherence protein C
LTEEAVLVVAGVLTWAGATLILSTRARWSRLSLTERLQPFHPGPGVVPSVAPTVGTVWLPVIRDVGDRVAGFLGVSESAERRLRRIHSDKSATVFRVRQMGWAFAGAVGGALVSGAVSAPAAVALLLVVGSPALVFLLVEQRLAGQSEKWQQQTAAEAPVVAEQLAMLLNAGFSLGAAVQRLARQGRGCVARDLDVVVNRVQQGLSEREALQEWADLAGVECVTRLVSVLTLHSEAAALGRLVSAEARSARRDLQRRNIEEIERRSQQVWVPVTVATLVPGAILLAVPFLAALRLFTNA